MIDQGQGCTLHRLGSNKQTSERVINSPLQSSQVQSLIHLIQPIGNILNHHHLVLSCLSHFLGTAGKGKLENLLVYLFCPIWLACIDKMYQPMTVIKCKIVKLNDKPHYLFIWLETIIYASFLAASVEKIF